MIRTQKAPEDTIESLRKNLNYMLGVSRRHREHQGAVLAATRSVFDMPVLVGDLHSHSTFSDGFGSVSENWDMAKAAGLDFLFVTDHMSIAQKQDCREPGLWWGQEPGIGGHHLALLAPKRLFTPSLDGTVQDYRRAKKLSPFVFFPHPAGWWPRTWYEDDRIHELDEIEEPFAMEVLNGANKLDRAYDAFDAAAQQIWDRLLTLGRKITGLGGSDAHSPQGIGCAWTGVFGARKELDSVIQALTAGHCFASEGPVLLLRSRNCTMGDTIKLRAGGEATLWMRAAYAPGLHSVRLIASGGKTVKAYRCDDDPLFENSLVIRATSQPTYYRMEARGIDDRRAFGSALFLSPP